MNNKFKFDDIYNELYNIKCHGCVPIIQYKNLVNNIKGYIDRCSNDNHNDYYYDILDIYHDLIELSKHTTTKGHVKKVLFNKLYDKVHNKFLLKESKIKLDVSQK
jgi:hypothetical protein